MVPVMIWSCLVLTWMISTTSEARPRRNEQRTKFLPVRENGFPTSTSTPERRRYANICGPGMQWPPNSTQLESTFFNNYNSQTSVSVFSRQRQLLDLNLPRLHGFDVLEWMRVTPACENLKVIVCTASDSGRYVERARKLGARLMLKPRDLKALEKFVAAISQFLADENPMASEADDR